MNNQITNKRRYGIKHRNQTKPIKDKTLRFNFLYVFFSIICSVCAIKFKTASIAEEHHTHTHTHIYIYIYIGIYSMTHK